MNKTHKVKKRSIFESLGPNGSQNQEKRRDNARSNQVERPREERSRASHYSSPRFTSRLNNNWLEEGACCREISPPLISITRLLPLATKLTRLTTHVRGLLYFTNYHNHGYKGFRLYNKTLDEWKQHTRRVFIGQKTAYIDWEHQQNKTDKGLSKKTKSSKKRTCHEKIVFKDKHIRKNIPTLYIL
jgi:hypothetical protein